MRLGGSITPLRLLPRRGRRRRRLGPVERHRRQRRLRAEVLPGDAPSRSASTCATTSSGSSCSSEMIVVNDMSATVGPQPLLAGEGMTMQPPSTLVAVAAGSCTPPPPAPRGARSAGDEDSGGEAAAAPSAAAPPRDDRSGQAARRVRSAARRSCFARAPAPSWSRKASTRRSSAPAALEGRARLRPPSRGDSPGRQLDLGLGRKAAGRRADQGLRAPDQAGIARA